MKYLHPDKKFYEVFTTEQICEIIDNLESYHEILRQYNYVDHGAKNWDTYSDQRLNAESPNLLKCTVALMRTNLSAVDELVKGYDAVNVADIGPGNALPAKKLLEHLVQKKILNRYIAIDISREMLTIAKKNIKEWFGDKVAFEGYVRDVARERFDDVLADTSIGKGEAKIVNLALLLGATPMNFRQPDVFLATISRNLNQDDMLIYTDKVELDEEARTASPALYSGVTSLPVNHSYIFKLLNIDESYFDVESGVDEQQKMCYVRVRLKDDLTITVSDGGSERDVYLQKGNTILLWRCWLMSAFEIIVLFRNAGFALQQLSLTKDREYLLTISSVIR